MAQNYMEFLKKKTEGQKVRGLIRKQVMGYDKPELNFGEEVSSRGVKNVDDIKNNVYIKPPKVSIKFSPELQKQIDEGPANAKRRKEERDLKNITLKKQYEEDQKLNNFYGLKLFSDEKEAVKKMKTDGLKESDMLDMIKTRRNELFGNLDDKEYKAIEKMSLDGMKSNEAQGLLNSYRKDLQTKQQQTEENKGFIQKGLEKSMYTPYTTEELENSATTGEALGKYGANIVGSTYNILPGLANLGRGIITTAGESSAMAFQKVTGLIDEADYKAYEDEMASKTKALWDSLYKDTLNPYIETGKYALTKPTASLGLSKQYGNLEPIKKKLVEDPVSIISDLLSVIGIGAMAKNKMNSIQKTKTINQIDTNLKMLDDAIKNPSLTAEQILALNNSKNQLQTYKTEFTKPDTPVSNKFFSKDQFSAKNIEKVMTKYDPYVAVPGAVIKGVSKGAEVIKDRTQNKYLNKAYSNYKKGVAPGVQYERNSAQDLAQKESIKTFGKDIVDNVNDLKYRDIEGNVVDGGRLPKTINETKQALKQRLDKLYEEYRDIETQTGLGKEVDYSLVVKRLEEYKNKISTNPELQDLIPYIDRKIDTYSNMPGSLDDVINAKKTINERLSKIYSRKDFKNIGEDAVDVLVNKVLGEILDDGIKNSNYGDIKKKWGSLRNLQDQIYHRDTVVGRQKDFGFFDLANPITSLEIIDFLMTQNPTSLVKATGVQTAKWWMKKVNSPDFQIKEFFKNIQKGVKKGQITETTGLTPKKDGNIVDKPIKVADDFIEKKGMSLKERKDQIKQQAKAERDQIKQQKQEQKKQEKEAKQKEKEEQRIIKKNQTDQEKEVKQKEKEKQGLIKKQEKEKQKLIKKKELEAKQEKRKLETLETIAKYDEVYEATLDNINVSGDKTQLKGIINDIMGKVKNKEIDLIRAKKLLNIIHNKKIQLSKTIKKPKAEKNTNKGLTKKDGGDDTTLGTPAKKPTTPKKEKTKTPTKTKEEIQKNNAEKKQVIDEIKKDNILNANDEKKLNEMSLEDLKVERDRIKAEKIKADEQKEIESAKLKELKEKETKNEPKTPKTEPTTNEKVKEDVIQGKEEKEVNLEEVFKDNPEVKELFEKQKQINEDFANKNKYTLQLDSDFDVLPKNEKGNPTFELPKTKGKEKVIVEAKNDYVLSIDGKRYIDLPIMTREEALKLANSKGVNKYYDVLPKQYVEHLGYKKINDTMGLTKPIDTPKPTIKKPSDVIQGNIDDILRAVDEELLTLDEDTKLKLVEAIVELDKEMSNVGKTDNIDITDKLTNEKLKKANEYNDALKSGDKEEIKRTKKEYQKARDDLAKYKNKNETKSEEEIQKTNERQTRNNEFKNKLNDFYKGIIDEDFIITTSKSDKYKNGENDGFWLVLKNNLDYNGKPKKTFIGSYFDLNKNFDEAKKYIKDIPFNEGAKIKKPTTETHKPPITKPTPTINKEALAKVKEDFKNKKGLKPKDDVMQGDGTLTPKTIKVYIKSKFSDKGGYKDIPIIREEKNITLYQGSKPGETRQFWTENKKYASRFGEVKEKTGDFYKVDNDNRVVSVYVEKPKTILSPNTSKNDVSNKTIKKPTINKEALAKVKENFKNKKGLKPKEEVKTETKPLQNIKDVEDLDNANITKKQFGYGYIYKVLGDDGNLSFYGSDGKLIKGNNQDLLKEFNSIQGEENILLGKYRGYGKVVKDTNGKKLIKRENGEYIIQEGDKIIKENIYQLEIDKNGYYRLKDYYTLKGKTQYNYFDKDLNFVTKTTKETLPKEFRQTHLTPNTPKNDVSNKTNKKSTETGGETIKNKVGDFVDKVAEKVGAKINLFGGEGAMRTPVSNLERAKNMESAGHSAEKIWEKTGWEKGKDGKWKFEIDDSEAKVNSIESNRLEKADISLMNSKDKNPRAIMLPDLLNYPELYKQYPNLEHIRVRFDKGNFNGNIDDELNITLTNKYLNKIGGEFKLAPVFIGGELRDIKSTLLHEIQHYIQQEEGFAKGGSSNDILQNKIMYKKFNKKKEDLLNKNLFYEWLGDFSKTKKYDDLIEKSNYSFTDLYKEFAKDKFDKVKQKEFLDEIKYLIQKKDEFNIGNSNMDEYEIYKSLSGEVEARNVQKRLGLTPKERKTLRPAKTEDITRDKQIVKMNGGKAMSVSDDLISEAKKYKSFEEFKKAQGGPVYHGTNAKFEEFDINKIGSNYGVDKKGIFFTNDIKSAEEYAKGTVDYFKSGQPNVLKRYIAMKKPFIQESYYTNAQQHFDIIRDRGELDDIIKQGYDGIIIKNKIVPENELKNAWRGTNEGGDLYVSLDIKNIKTEAQLKQIYEQANKPKKGLTPKK